MSERCWYLSAGDPTYCITHKLFQSQHVSRLDPSPPVKPEPLCRCGVPKDAPVHTCGHHGFSPRPEPRTSEPSEALSPEMQRAVEDALGTLFKACGRGHDWEILNVLARGVARAAKVEALSEVAKAGCRWCREGAPFVRLGLHGVKHKGRKACEHRCSRPEVWDAIQALQEGGR